MLQIVKFPSLRSQAVIFTVLLCWICFFLFTTKILMLLSQFSLTPNSNGGLLFIAQLLIFILLINKGWSCLISKRYSMGRYVKSGFFCSYFCILSSGPSCISFNIHHQKYLVKFHSSPWFSTTCATVITYRNHFCHLHQSLLSFSPTEDIFYI